MKWLESAVTNLGSLESVAVEQLTSGGTPVTHTYGSVLGSACRLADALDSRVRGRISDSSTIGILTGNGVEVVDVRVGGDYDPDAIGARVKLARDHHADQICKIVHTSGTTSTPKGVMLRRGAVDDLIDSIASRVGVEAWQRYVSVVPLSLLV